MSGLVQPAALLFTDVEGSTRMARALGDAWPQVVADHHRILRESIEARRGAVERITGDSFFALFESAEDAAAAAVDAQRALASHAWPPAADGFSVRMGIHRGVVDRSAGDLTGLDIHLAARVEAAAHGGQVLVTEAVRDALDGGFDLADLGDHRLKDFPVAEHLFQLVHDGRGPDAFPPPRTELVRPTNLPAQPRPLLGREAELNLLWDLLGTGGERLVTLLGLGGTGKTRLAVAAAEGLLSAYEGGVWLVPLAGVADESGIVPAIAGAIGVPDEGGTPLAEAVTERLRERPTLLVLDNFEHLAGAAPVVAELLAGAPPARALVTSQLPLRLTAERVVELGPLRAVAAAALFEQRARAVRPGFAAADDPDTVEAICARLDGSPLALELAAARVAVLSPRELLTRLDRSLQVLTRGPRDLPERQRSLRATLAWAHDLLDPEAQRLFARLGAFAGPAPLDAVEAIAAVDALDAVSELMEASLVRRVESRVHGLRYDMPQAVRDFAVEQLAASGEEDATRRAHAAHIAELGEAYRVWYAGAAGRPRTRVEALEAEQRVALGWTRENDPALHLRVAAALGSIFIRSSRTRLAYEELGVALARNPAPGPDAGWAALIFEVAGTTLGEPLDAGKLERVLDQVRAGGDDRLLSAALRAVSITLAMEGSGEAALAASEEMVAIERRRGEDAGLAQALMVHGQSLLSVGRLDEASAVLDEGAVLAAAVGDPQLSMAGVAADVALEREDWVGAARLYAESIVAAGERRCTQQMVMDFQSLVLAFVPLGRAEAALEASAVAAAIHAETGEIGIEGTPWQDRYESALAQAEAGAGPERTAAARAHGAAIAPADRPARAVELADAAAASAPVRHA